MIYVDACVPIYATLDAGPKGEWSRALLKDLEEGVKPGATSALTIDEFVYKVGKAEGLQTALSTGRGLLLMPHLRLLPVDDAVLWKSLEVMEEHGLDPRDSIHAASALLQGIHMIASEDDDFDEIPELERMWPG